MTARIDLTPDEVVRLAVAGDQDGLRRRCADVLAAGASPGDVVRRCLAPAQVTVGERWLRHELSVADEHRATAVVDAVLAGLELGLPPPGGDAPTLLAVCAEGEWHAIAVRMLTILAAEPGVEVVCLGPSLPARDLAAAAASLRADGVLLSCSSVAALPGAVRCVEELAQVDVRVALGGHAFRAVPSAAAALRSTVVDDVAGAVDVLGTPAAAAGPVLDPGAAVAVAMLDVAEPRLVDATARCFAAERGSALHDAVGHLLGFARAAVQFGDPGIVTSHREWVDIFLAARDVPERFEQLADAAAEHAASVLDDPGPLRTALRR